MRRSILPGSLLVTILFLMATPSVHAAKGVQGSPKIINLYLDWQLKEEDLASLARWDVVVLDADQQARYPDRVRKLKQLNPAIKLLAYLPSEEVASARFSEPPEYPFAKLSSRIQESWYLHDPNGNKAYFWPGSALLNVTDRGPAGPTGQRWNDFLPHFIHDEVLSSGMWDGVFLDNTFDSISYFSKSPVDLDRNGQAEAAADQNAAWRDGMRKMLRNMRQLNPNAIIMGNGGAVYADQLNGAFFEHFPSWNWAANWKEYRDALAKNPAPSYGGMNVNTDNAERPNDYKLMRYGLGSALVGGGYYSFDKGDYNHDVLWWYDEYETALGAPRADVKIIAGASGSGIVPAVWSRSFENGLALVNSTDRAQHVVLPGVFEKLHGRQDASTNSGTVLTAVDIPAHDGLLLIRRGEVATVKVGSFQNGTFVRPYDASGRSVQNGFFAQRTDAPSGAQVVVADVDRDGKDDVVVADRGSVSVRLASAKTPTTFWPFGKAYVGALGLAVGNANRDAPLEIVVSRYASAPPDVLVLTAAGKELARFMPYAAGFRGGSQVGIGDLNSDGLREIVTGAGPGGGPHVRIWKTDGSAWGASFFAFDPSERGGVSIAVGDVDGDGKDEIIAGSGQGALPRVRIFDGTGILKREITMGSRPIAAGLHVTTSDINGDKKAEILVSGLPLF